MCEREFVHVCVIVCMCTRSKKKLTYVTQHDVSGVLVVALRDGDREKFRRREAQSQIVTKTER